MKKLFLTTASVLLTTVMAMGAAFQLNMQGLREMAMGGTGVASSWDASTIYYNPAGLSNLKHIQLYGNLLFAMPSAQYAEVVGSYHATTKNQTFYPVNIYIGGPVRKGSNVAVGLGFYSAFAIDSKWGDQWSGRYIVENEQLRTYFLQPTVSYRFNKAISVGAGFIYAFGTYNMRQAVPVQSYLNNTDGQAEYFARPSGIGFNAGVQIKPWKWLHIGLNYRSQINMKTRGGSLEFSNMPNSIASMFPNAKYTNTLALPATASIGFAIKPTQELTINFDINFVGWHSIDSARYLYDRNVNGKTELDVPRNYRNRAAFRLGANYKLGGGWSLMAGAAIDPSPVQNGYVSPEMPDVDSYELSTGFSYKPIKRITLMAAIQYRTSNKENQYYDFAGFNGKYQTKSIATGIGMSYNF